MGANQSNSETTLINVVDKETHQAILRVNQKLRGLSVEIDAKIENLILEQSSEAIEARKKQLMKLSNEVKTAIGNIKTLMNVVVAANLSPEEFNRENQHKIEAFRNLLKVCVDKIIRIQDKF